MDGTTVSALPRNAKTGAQLSQQAIKQALLRCHLTLDRSVKVLSKVSVDKAVELDWLVGWLLHLRLYESTTM